MDTALKELARRFGCVYTRYADDITFSSSRNRFPPAIAYVDATTKAWKIGDELRQAILDAGFAVNESKTRVRRKTARQEVTGITINSQLNVDRRLIRQIRAMLHAWEKWGEDAAQAHFWTQHDKKHRKNKKPRFREVVAGKIAFVGHIRRRDDLLYVSLATRYADLTGRPFRPITVTRDAPTELVTSAVWMVLDQDRGAIATAFALAGYGLMTANHVAEQAAYVTQVGDADPHAYPVIRAECDERSDVARLHTTAPLSIQLAIGDSVGLGVDSPITLLGYPRPRAGDQVAVDRGTIVQVKTLNGVRHCRISQIIVKGNSGGPVLDQDNHVVAVAVRGVETPGRVGEDDELPLVVPESEWAHQLHKKAAATP